MNCQDRKLFEELEQENATLRARWEKLKEFLNRDGKTNEHTYIKSLYVIRKMEELEQDD